MKTPTIKDLYPHLTDEELKIAEENLDRYLILVLRIFERLENEKGLKEVARIIRAFKSENLEPSDDDIGR